MINDFDSALRMAQSLLMKYDNVTEANIDEAVEPIKLLQQLGGGFQSVDLSILKAKLMEIFHATMDHARILEGKERRLPWIKAFKAEEKSNWHFWQDYKKYLEEVKMFPKAVVNELEGLTDTILDKLFDPNQKGVVLHKKGMVVGQVQSGKTSNYTGLICKAADAGYNFIIVLAGMHNNLRSQTQLRLDEGFLGFDTQYERAYKLHSESNMGVGKLPTPHDHPVAHSFTSSFEKGDFNKRIAEGQGFNFNTNEPILLVVKKNKSVLTNLYNWLTSKIAPEDQCSTKSLLIIDDEADNASINTKKDGDPSAINDCIRKILSKFQKVGYVGYTATPFANIFIPLQDDDLFPRDFIINLPTPPNYIGPQRVFGIDGEDDDETVLPIVRKIDDYESFVPTKHKKDDPKPTEHDVPDSLKEAIKCFILTCAVRWARGQVHEHNSMLIHVSRFQVWQNHIKELVEKLFNYYKEELIYGDKDMEESFRRLYEEDANGFLSYKTITEKVLESSYKDPEIRHIPWKEVLPCLRKAVKKIEIKSINGTSADILSYYENKANGISAIVIGGDKLSRGLTLEGLSVSYFLRASKMYDTLMQMGRWFGYRPGYADLCRLYTSSELNEWFRHITTASEELRKEFIYLCDIGSTPDRYKLKVRSHPGCLQITAANKMRHVDHINVSWAGRLLETYGLCNNKKMKHLNLVYTDELLKKLSSSYTQKEGHFVWTKVSPYIITSFINQFTIDPDHKTADLSVIQQYIEKLNGYDELTEWSVVLINKTTAPTAEWVYSNGIRVGCSKRTRANDTDDRSYCIRNGHIIGRWDELIDLDEQTLSSALTRTKEIKEAAGEEWKEKFPSQAIVREEYRNVKNPVLLIYTLDPYYANVIENGEIKKGTLEHKHDDEPFIGFAISFPHTNTSFEGVQYTANLINEFAATEEAFEEENDNDYSDD